MSVQGKVDYGWYLNGQKILVSQDRSIIFDESLQDIVALLKDSSHNYYFIERCMQCGICTNSCPQHLINSEFSPRLLIQKLRLGLIDESMEEMWTCTNCGACELSCPFEVTFLTVQRELRSLIMENSFGYIPRELKNAVNSVQYYYNPWSFNQQERLKKKSLSESTDKQKSDYILFLGCFASYESHGKRIAQAVMSILDNAGISYDILGEDEVCCGDCAYRTGAVSVFEQMRELNLAAFQATGIKNILTICPHSFDVLRKNYFTEQDDYNVVPLSLFVLDLLAQQSLKLPKKLDMKVTFHDPCFFAKHNGISDEFREVLHAIGGIELAEMERHGAKSICCGGGGGGVFMDTKKGERLSEIRINEALDTKAEIMVTACPICAVMFDDTVNNREDMPLEIVDFFELIARVI